MFRKMILTVVCVLGFSQGLFAGGQGSESASAENTEPRTLIFHTVSVPGDAHTQAIYTLKETTEALSGGMLLIDVYDSGALYKDGTETTALKRGDIDMAYTAPANPLYDSLIPQFNILSAAFLFRDYDHMRSTLSGETGAMIFSQIEQTAGVRPLAAYYLGTRQLNLRDIGREVRTPDDMKGVKLRTPASPSWIAMGKALGANPTPMSFGEVYMALKTGVIDGQDNPLPTDFNAKFYEVTKYIILTDHRVDSVWPTINSGSWNSLSSEEQEWLTEGIIAGQEFCDTANLEREAELVSFFKDEGMVIIEDPDKDAFAAFARNVYNADAEVAGKWDWSLWDTIRDAD